MLSIRKTINITVLAGCLGFMFLGLYLYFVKGVPLQPMLVLSILFFGTCAIISIVSLISNRESWVIDIRKLTKKQAIILSICGIIFSICSLWVAIVIPLHIILRLILFIGFITIGKWSIGLIFKNTK